MSGPSSSSSEVPSPNERPLRLGARQLIELYGQLGRSLEAGLPLTETLTLVARSSKGQAAAVMEQVRQALDQGQALSQALSTLVPSSASPLILAGERTGSLPAAFFSLAASVEMRLDIQRQIIRACIFPLVLFTLAFFVPRAYLLLSEGWIGYLRACLVPWLMGLGAVAAVVWGLPRALSLLLGAERRAHLVRTLPVLRGLLRLAAEQRFCENLAAAMEAGLTMPQCLQLAAQATGDPMWQQRLKQAEQFIESGGTLHQSLERVRLLDQGLLMTLATGERAGCLPESLRQRARLTRSTLTHRLNVVLQLFAVVILIMTYALVTQRVISEYQSVLTRGRSQIDQLLKDLTGGSSGAGGELNKLLEQLGKQGGGVNIDELLKRAADPSGIKQLPEDVRRHLE